MYSRLRAFLIHFIGSILLVCLASALVFLIWHPAPLHQAVGATNMFVIIMAVDVVLGPLMTLIVYKRRRRRPGRFRSPAVRRRSVHAWATSAASG